MPQEQSTSKLKVKNEKLKVKNGECSHFRCKKKCKKRGMCDTHYKQWYRENYKMQACYQNLKDNAKRREIFFDLTFDDFKEFCIETTYLIGKGRHKTGYTIDRIDEEKGYTRGNIQVLKNEDNVKKQRRREKILKYEYQFKIAFFEEIKEFKDLDKEVPF